MLLSLFKKILPNSHGYHLSTVNEGCCIKGEIKHKGTLLILGEVYGSIEVDGTVIVAKCGKVIGSCTCHEIKIAGSFDGDINSGNCLIKDKASVTGDIRVNHLSIDGADTSGLILQIRPREVIALSNSVPVESVENPFKEVESVGTGNITC
jgi:hypothetical protein